MSLAAMTQVFLAIIFTLSSVLKIINRGAFEEVLGELFSSTRLVTTGVWLIPIAELLGGILLLVKGREIIGQIVLLSLMAGFSWAHWSVISRRKRVACNCFGTLVADTFGWKSATRILVLLVLVVYLIMSGDSGLHEFALVDWANASFMSVGILFVYSLVTVIPSEAPSQVDTRNGVKS